MTSSFGPALDGPTAGVPPQVHALLARLSFQSGAVQLGPTRSASRLALVCWTRSNGNRARGRQTRNQVSVWLVLSLRFVVTRQREFSSAVNSETWRHSASPCRQQGCKRHTRKASGQPSGLTRAVANRWLTTPPSSRPSNIVPSEASSDVNGGFAPVWSAMRTDVLLELAGRNVRANGPIRRVFSRTRLPFTHWPAR